jgi:hypothetical protein
VTLSQSELHELCERVEATVQQFFAPEVVAQLHQRVLDAIMSDIRAIVRDEVAREVREIVREKFDAMVTINVRSVSD